MLGVLGASISIANLIVAIRILTVLTMVFFVELIGMAFGSLLLLDPRRVLWQQGALFPLLLSIAPKISMLKTLASGLVVMTLAPLTTLCGLVLVVLVTWISHLDRVKFSWLGLGGSSLARLLTWNVFMLGLFLCNVESGISGMALSAMSVLAHVCSFVMLLGSLFFLRFSPLLLGVDYWWVSGAYVRGCCALWFG